jgi:tetratricopeptide (TPR) repeat protein
MVRAFAAILLFLQGAFLHAADPGAEGMKALQEEKYEAAVEAFRKAVELAPDDYSAHFHLALAYSFLNRDAEGIAEYRRTLELKPGLYEAQLNAGILLSRQKNFAEAVPLLRQAVEQKPNEARPRLYLAQALLATRELTLAEENFKALAELDPKSAAARLGLAQAIARQNRLPEAAPHFREAARLDPDYQDALLELAGLYENAGQFTDAIAIYREFPSNPAAQERMGQLLLETKQYADAIPRLEEAYAKAPTTANLTALAAAYLFNKQNDKAIPLLDKSVAAEPQSYDLRMMYGRALRDQKQYSPSAEQFYEAVKLKQDSREAWNDLAGMFYLLASQDESAAASELNREPNKPSAALQRAQQRYQQSLAAFDHARRLGEDTAANWYFRAIIQDKLKDLKSALESYQRFLELSEGKNPDEEFKARQRIRIIQKELSRK